MRCVPQATPVLTDAAGQRCQAVARDQKAPEPEKRLAGFALPALPFPPGSMAMTFSVEVATVTRSRPTAGSGRGLRQGASRVTVRLECRLFRERDATRWWRHIVAGARA